MNIKRPIAFILAASNHGTLIVNRNDFNVMANGNGYGVGYQILATSSFDPEEVDMATALLSLRRQYFGDGVVAIDCGANIGVHTVEWAKHMYGWGSIEGFEAQERIFYALAGNVAINNCMNATVHYAAIGAENGQMKVPVADPLIPASFGSLELKQGAGNEHIGQHISYSDDAMRDVRLRSIDSYCWPRVDFIKIDVEGMEDDVLKGAKETIANSIPILIIETIKTDMIWVNNFLSDYGYKHYHFGINLLCIHESDPVCNHLAVIDGGFSIHA